MKILELEIDNLRGIRHLELKPEGRNFLISGPNGSGKSAIVDAIDFLLTGDISRMKGKGTKGIYLKKHGCHIDAKPEDSCVKAIVKIHGVEESVEIKRNFKDNKKLIIDSEFFDEFKPILELASRGQHVLTRREILNFVTAEASTRAGQVQKLLKLDSIEDHRKKLGNVRNTLKREFENVDNNLNRARIDVSVTIGEDEVTSENILDFINKQRKILGGTSFDEIDYSRLKDDLNPPASRPESRLNPELLRKDLQNIENTTTNNVIFSKDEELREIAGKFSDSPHLGGAVKRLRLTTLGMGLLDEDGLCPLCGISWDPSELKDHLESQIRMYQEAQNDLDQMEKLSKYILECINRLRTSLIEISNALGEWKLKKEHEIFNDWIKELDKLSDILGDLEHYPDNKFPHDKVRNLLAPDNINELLKQLNSIIMEMAPEITPEQTAWDNLTRLEGNLKLYGQAQKDYDKSLNSYEKSEILLESFLKAREKVLNQLYTKIKDRFVELYRELHDIDESEFEAILVSSGAGIDLQVGFHGRGEHPPHALHSEGHQDSMGICLYLALAEQLTQGIIDLIVLDDVMMSVDAPHRRKICHLLADFFKGRQFFITTHDQTWARQLQSEKVITSKNRVELSNWTIEDGPVLNTYGDIWERIEEDLLKNDVPAAAARLRRGSEEYFTQICSALKAPVKFKSTGQYELGDLFNGGTKAYNKLLNDAKKSARYWEKEEELEALEEIEEYSKKIFDKMNRERWAVNPAVHFNKWAEFTPEDFKPVVDSFYDLFSLFQCENCNSFLYLTEKNNKNESVKCDCGDIYWNLKKKE